MISNETRLKMRLAKLGKKRPSHSKQTKNKIRLANLGQKRSLITRQKQSNSKKIYYSKKENRVKHGKIIKKAKAKNKLPIEIRYCICGCKETFNCRINSKRQYISGHNRRGKEMSLHSRLQISKSMKKLFGNKNYSENTLNRNTRKQYPSEFNKKLKEQIKKRDNHTCQFCSTTEKESLKKYRKKLSVHHIDFNKENNVIYNLITLCISCNTKENFNDIITSSSFYYLLNESKTLNNFISFFKYT